MPAWCEPLNEWCVKERSVGSVGLPNARVGPETSLGWMNVTAQVDQVMWLERVAMMALKESGMILCSLAGPEEYDLIGRSCGRIQENVQLMAGPCSRSFPVVEACLMFPKPPLFAGCEAEAVGFDAVLLHCFVDIFEPTNERVVG